MSVYAPDDAFTESDAMERDAMEAMSNGGTHLQEPDPRKYSVSSAVEQVNCRPEYESMERVAAVMSEGRSAVLIPVSVAIWALYMPTSPVVQ